jgi:hypothetical protein
MRGSVTIGAVALSMMVARGALAQDLSPHCHGSCKWDLIIRYPSNGSQDLYPAADSREECERIIERLRAAHPDPAADEMTCVDSSRPDTWPHDLSSGTQPSKQP